MRWISGRAQPVASVRCAGAMSTRTGFSGSVTSYTRTESDRNPATRIWHSPEASPVLNGIVESTLFEGSLGLSAGFIVQVVLLLISSR